MTAVNETETVEATEAKAEKAFDPTPKTIHVSLATFVTNASGVEVSPEQAKAILTFHGKWQSSPERKAEREAELAAAAEEREAKKAAAAEAKAKRDAEKAEKAAAKKAKEAAAADDDSDLDDDLDGDEGGESAPAKKAPAKRSRRGKAAAEVAAEPVDELDDL